MLIHLFIGSIRQALSGASKMAALVTLLSLARSGCRHDFPPTLPTEEVIWVSIGNDSKKRRSDHARIAKEHGIKSGRVPCLGIDQGFRRSNITTETAMRRMAAALTSRVVIRSKSCAMVGIDTIRSRKWESVLQTTLSPTPLVLIHPIELTNFEHGSEEPEGTFSKERHFPLLRGLGDCRWLPTTL